MEGGTCQKIEFNTFHLQLGREQGRGVLHFSTLIIGFCRLNWRQAA